MTLEERLEFLEKLLRDNDIHEYECSVAQAARANARGYAYHTPQPCNCWLSQKRE